LAETSTALPFGSTMPRASARGEATRGLVALQDVPQAAWSRLAARAIEPNAYYEPAWAKAACAHARGHGGAKALLAFDGNERLIGLLPVLPASKALSLPLPMLVAWQAYAPLTTPLLDRDTAQDAADLLIEVACAAGARALLLPFLAIEGPAAQAFRRALSRRGLRTDILHSHVRAQLDATGDAQLILQAALGAKKLKELRRQRNRLADDGPVTFTVATTPDAVACALDDFLALEARGWKGRRGTALTQDAGDLAFIRQATGALAATNQLQIATLTRGGVPVASGLVLRQGDRAFFFKIAYDEREAKTSPGVQLTLDLTAHLCADPDVTGADSTAIARHPMIDHVWRARFAMADLFVPLKAHDSLAPILRNIVLTRNAARDGARAILHAFQRFREK